MKSTAMFVAYLHCRPDGTPFYVGKGSAKRARLLSRRCNPHYNRVVEKHGKENILIGSLECSDEAAAFELEKGLIKRLKAMGCPLANVTDGGEGVSGFRHTELARKKISAGKVGNKWNLGRSYTHAARLKRSRSQGCLGVIGRNGDTVVYFATIAEAARAIGSSIPNILSHLRHRSQRSKGVKGGWFFERAK